MSETVKGRRSIHDRDSNSSQRGKSVLDERENLNDSQENINFNDSQGHITTESGSDLEGFEDNDSFMGAKCSKRNIFEISRSPPMTPQRRKRSPVNDSPRPIYTNQSRKPLQETKNKAKEKDMSWIIAVIMIVIAAIIYYSWPEATTKVKSCSFENLEKLYPQQEPKLWRSLKVGIEMILNNRTPKPAIYLFAHHGGDQTFNLIKNITTHSSSCFDQKMIPIEIENDDFISAPGTEDDYGHVIEKYKAKIKQGNVILIANLNEIPAKAARALHFICDTYSPIAKDVVIFLTLNIAENKEGGDSEKAENTLKELWEAELSINEIDALITRVTDQVFVLKG